MQRPVLALEIKIEFQALISDFHIILGLGELQSAVSDRECPSNPFLLETSKQSSLLDVAVDVLTVVSSRRNPRKYKKLSLSVVV